MGTMTHGNIALDLEDRVLAHLQIVIVRRFQRHEPVLLSWLNALSSGDGRSSLWMTPELPVYFQFHGSRAPRIDPEWLARLTDAAASSTGLVVMDEDGRLIRAQRARTLGI